MAQPRTLFLILFGVHFMQTYAGDKYTDENRPYEFGFTIEGEQHRHEKKDENGIIMGEFGFITADGVYHVTVYATDENGNFKILSMKNIRVKPYPTSPGAGVKKEHSLNYSAAQKDSISESTKQDKVTHDVVNSSPVKSCSHCRLPTTTTLSPIMPNEAAKSINTYLRGNSNNNQNAKNINTKQMISTQNFGYQPKENNPKTYQRNSQINDQNLSQQNQNNKHLGNQNSISPQTSNYQEPNHKSSLSQPNTQTIGESYPSSDLVSNSSPQTISQDNAQNSYQQSRPLNVKQQIQNQNPLLSNEGQKHTSVPTKQNISPLGSQDISSISRNSQGAINEDRYVQTQTSMQNKQPVLGATNLNKNTLNNGVQIHTQQQQNNKQISQIDQFKLGNFPTIKTGSQITSQPHTAPISHNVGEQPTKGYVKGDRNPKSFVNFIQQSVEPQEVASTGPNLYRPSLPNPSDFSGKPALLAAQMQIVDKKTDIHHLNSGENVGLPKGITKDDMTNLLYTFNYTVGFHGHHEKGYSNGAKQGYYYVTARNGVRTRVDYVADETGFHPKFSQEILDIISDEVPKPETEKDEKYGLKGYEFKWLYFPVDAKSK